MLTEHGIHEPKETDKEKGWTVVTKKRCKKDTLEDVAQPIVNATKSTNFKKKKENTPRKSKDDGSKSIKSVKLMIPASDVKDQKNDQGTQNHKCNDSKKDSPTKGKEKAGKKTYQLKSKIHGV